MKLRIRMREDAAEYTHDVRHDLVVEAEGPDALAKFAAFLSQQDRLGIMAVIALENGLPTAIWARDVAQVTPL